MLAEDNREQHSWELLAVDKKTGAIAWQKTVHRGEPRVKRHMKASHASATPATDGRRLVAIFGSEGLYCFDMQGGLLWKKDLGVLDAGYLKRPELQWGPASSPVIYRNMVIVQSDNHADSSLMALNLDDGKVIWRTDRKERPAWSTPVIFRGDREELITNGGLFLRAYDPQLGKELWRFQNDSEVIVPTPVVGDGVVIVTGGAPRNARPLFAIRPGGQGDISPTSDQSGSRFLAWQVDKASTYVPTPIIYQRILYVCEDNGILSAYESSTGKNLYRTRLQVGAGFSGSPVASDGRLYFPSEDGDVMVVRAGPEFELLAANPMGEALMATPALSDQLMIVRGRQHLFAVGVRNPVRDEAPDCRD